MKNCKTYYDVRNSKKRVVVNQGGTRSGKTYSIVQCLVEICHSNPFAGAVITICRKSLPSIKGSVLRDFIEILSKENIYSENNFNKSELTYNLFGNTVEFISIDQPQKIRGRKRNILYINEANELDYDSWIQLALRTTGKIIIDYNPSDEYSYIYDHILTRDDHEFHRTTYKDNPHLSKEIVSEIERLKNTDANYWNVFGLGERGFSGATIFTHHQIIESLPKGGDFNYGLDFGYNHPTALTKVVYKDDSFYWRQEIYRSGMTTSDLIKLMNEMQIDKRKEMIADSAEPKTIEEIRRAGYNIHPADKSVKAGIDAIKSRQLFITSDSLDLLKEIKNYKWKTDKDGRKLDEPVKFADDAMDSARYPSYHFVKPRNKSGRSTVV